jgi:hypothetical protein
MNWPTPKTDWASNDVLSSTEFNNIGANLNMLLNTFEISASVPSYNDYLYDWVLYQTAISIPAGKKLVLRRYRASFVDTSNIPPVPIIPEVYIFGEANKYDPGASVADNAPDFDLYSNSTASAELKILYVYEQSEGSKAADGGSGFHLTLEIVDI